MLNTPKPSAESRKRTVKTLGEFCEVAKKRIRGVRRDAREGGKKAEGVGEDDVYAMEKMVDAVAKSFVEEVDSVKSKAEAEIMAVG